MFCSGNGKWINQLAFCVHIQLRLVCGAIDLSTSMGVPFLCAVVVRFLYFFRLNCIIASLILPVLMSSSASAFDIRWLSLVFVPFCTRLCSKQTQEKKSTSNEITNTTNRHKFQNSWYYKFIIFSHQKTIYSSWAFCKQIKLSRWLEQLIPYASSLIPTFYSFEIQDAKQPLFTWWKTDIAARF